MLIKRLIDKGIKAVGNTSGKVVQSAKNTTDDVKDKFMSGYLQSVEQKCKKCGKSFTYPKESDYVYDECFCDKATQMKTSVDAIRQHGMCSDCYYKYILAKLESRIVSISKTIARDIDEEMSKSTAPLIKKYGDRWEELKNLLEKGQVNCAYNFWGFQGDIEDISDHELEKTIMYSALYQVYSDDSGIAGRIYDEIYQGKR